MNIRNLTKNEINEIFKDNLKKQMIEKNMDDPDNIIRQRMISKGKDENDKKFLREEQHKKEKRDLLLQDVMESRKQNIITKKMIKDHEKEQNAIIEKSIVEKAIKGIQEEKNKIHMKKEIEKSNLDVILKQKINKESSKQKNKQKNIEQEKEYLNEFNKIMKQQEEDRTNYYAKIREKMKIQDERIKVTDNYYKSHTHEKNPNSSIIANENRKLQIISENIQKQKQKSKSKNKDKKSQMSQQQDQRSQKESSVAGSIMDEINNLNKNQTMKPLRKLPQSTAHKSNVMKNEILKYDYNESRQKREIMQKETNMILAQQDKDKEEQKKKSKDEKYNFRTSLNQEEKRYKDEKNELIKENQEKMSNYKNDIERQLESIRCNKYENNNFKASKVANVSNMSKGVSATLNMKERVDKSNNELIPQNNYRVNTLTDNCSFLPKIISELLQKLSLLGEFSIIRLENILKLCDIKNSDNINFKEFCDILIDFGICNSSNIKQEDIFFKIYTVFVNEDNSGEFIGISNFLKNLKGKFSGKRVLMIKKLYNLIIKDVVFKIFDKKQLTFEMLKKIIKGKCR